MLPLRHMKTNTRMTWLLFGHATAVFIVATINLAIDWKLFEVLFVTCYEDSAMPNLVEIVFGVMQIWLQDALLVCLIPYRGNGGVN